MKKRLFASMMAMMVAAGCLAGCGGGGSNSSSGDAAGATEGDTYNWKMALNSTAGDNAYDTAAVFADKVKELTDGKVNVELYGGASLGSTSEVLEGLSYGVADIICESVGTLATFTPLANIDAMPYIYNDYDHFMNVWYSDLGQEMKDTIGEASGFKLMGGTFRGPRIVTSTKEMHNVNDFKGFKLRAPNLEMYLKTWQWMGAAPTPMAMNETYTALQQGTVSGQENPMADSMNYAFNEVCKYWIKTNHVYSCNLFIMDANYFNGLPEDIQSAVTEAAEYAGQEVSVKQLEKEEAAEAKLVEEGCAVIDVDLDAFKAHFDGFADKNFPDLKDWTDRIKAMDAGE
ncbi:TRAP transporter substrate-binding protein [Anaerotignum sp.]|uniref:TRAP transporter substrate-binding protein n=1 Tax=Anaerotignum sp. TaxID=2039241 RepID=UPI0028B082E9|nr:TRAP transporter substrate-binding protein [Anaerotignum sp.]